MSSFSVSLSNPVVINVEIITINDKLNKFCSIVFMKQKRKPHFRKVGKTRVWEDFFIMQDNIGPD